MAILGTADFRAATKLWPDIEIPGDATTAITNSTLATAISAAEDIVSRYCRDDFSSGTAAGTIIVDGSGTRSLLLPKRVQSGAITSVEERDGDGVYTTIESTDYRYYASLNSSGDDFNIDGIDKVEYIASTGAWTEGVLNVRVIGTFGWNTAPWSVKRAVALVTYDWLAGRNAGQHRASSWQTPNASYVRADDVVLSIPEVGALLERYRFEADRIAAI